MRLKIFEWNLEHHSKLNSDRRENVSAVYGVTKFSDLTPQEFKERYLSSIKLSNHITKPEQRHHPRPLLFPTGFFPAGLPGKDIPLKVDWRKKGIITAVRNQHACGGCWAFSVVETIEAMNAINTGILSELSIQEVIDCSYGFSVLSGCNGGDTCAAFSWMKLSKTPLVPGRQYPLKDLQQTCKMLPNETRGVRVTNYTCQKLVNDEAFLMTLLASYGPVAVSVDATNWSNYQGGIIQYHCGEMGNNHAVQIIGYDRTAIMSKLGQKEWINNNPTETQNCMHTRRLSSTYSSIAMRPRHCMKKE
ncbi:Cathepsin O [Lamellibrachia satsuma]|nr:Cathepsin O [Lamellibrachia satsuma]